MTINLKVKSAFILSIFGVGITSISNSFISSFKSLSLISTDVLGLFSASSESLVQADHRLHLVEFVGDFGELSVEERLLSSDHLKV